MVNCGHLVFYGKYQAVQGPRSLHSCPNLFTIKFLARCSPSGPWDITHYGDVIMGTMPSQITSLTIVYLTVYSGADQSKHQSSASLAFVWGIHRGPVNSPHKGPVTRWRHHVLARFCKFFVGLVFQSYYTIVYLQILVWVSQMTYTLSLVSIRW